MKNLFLTMTAGLILLTGCSKDESLEQTELQTVDSFYVSKQYNGNTSWESMKIDINDNRNLNTNTEDTRGHGFTNGQYAPTNRNPLIITWNGTRNASGSSGSAEIQMSTPSYSFHFLMETECVTVIGNEAMYGGIITEVVEVTGNPPPFNRNWRFYFKVIDNEDGGNSGVDQISTMKIFASPRSISLCNEYPPNHQIWSSQGYNEAVNPGFVIVGN